LLISVENRSLPNWAANAGVPVPWMSAWTAIGMAGVAVSAIVGGITGVAEATNTVAVSVGAGVSVGGDAGTPVVVSVGGAAAGGTAVSVANVGVGGGAAGVALRCHERPTRSRPIANAPESTDSSTEPRACTM
jgi:hypothetical protein